MATTSQIEANRRNALKSTGPRTPEGQAVSRLNALKTGIDARSQVIPGESPEDLETLALDYHHRFHPEAPERSFLVDTLIQSEWLLRRYRKVEAQLWTYEMAALLTPNKKCSLGQAFNRGCDTFTRLQRRIDSAERNYHRALDKLQRFQSTPVTAPTPVPVPSDAPAEPAPQPEPETAPAPQPESATAATDLASFHQIPLCAGSSLPYSSGTRTTIPSFTRAIGSENEIIPLTCTPR
jgi:hypothetical protein